MNKGLNMQSVKNENRSLILYLLNSYGSLSRKEIASALSLTPAAVTKIAAELIENGLVKECGESQETGRSGRREILLTLCLDDKFVFGINAEKHAITFSYSSLAGDNLLLKRIPFSDDVDEVLKASAAFLKHEMIDQTKLIGAGVCIIGSPKEQDFGIWKDADLKEKFETTLGLPTVIANNVKAFAQSELIYGNKYSADSVLFLKWGPGVGSAIVKNGKVLSGNDSSVTEMGHYIVNKGGKKCRCGRYGCLETEVSEETILEEISPDGKISLDEILKNCDNKYDNVIDRKIDLVALALANTATILDTDNIVLFGTMFDNETVAEKLKKQCIRYNQHFDEDKIKLSSLNQKSGYIGAAAVCAKYFFFEKAI